MNAATKSTKSPAKASTYQLALIGIMSAVICILGPLTIPLPISPVPISFTNFAIYLAVFILGTKRGTLSYCIYLLLGFAGIPVFSAFTSGPAKLLGPTGGYLIGFIFMSLICGFFIEKFNTKPMHFTGLVLGTMAAYMFGSAWLSYQASLTFGQALMAGVVPYIIGDIIKIIIAIIAGTSIKKRLIKADLLNIK